MPGGRKRKYTVNSFSKEQFRLLQKELESKDDQKETYAIKGLKSLFKKWTEEDLCCIVKLKSDSKTLRAHRKALENVSEYFKGLFRFSDEREYTLDESIIKANLLDRIIWYAYTGNVDIYKEFVQDLFIAANYLQINVIQKRCDDFMAKHLMPENVIKLVPFANKFGANLLKDSICSFISDNFESVLNDACLLDLCPSDVKELLQNRNLSVFEGGIPVVNPEADILRFVAHYVSGQKQKLDDSCISELVQQIRFEEFRHPDELKMLLEAYPCLKCEKTNDAIKLIDKDGKYADTTHLIRRVFSNSNKYLKDGPVFMTGLNFTADPLFKNVDVLDRIEKIRIFTGKTNVGWNMIGSVNIHYHSGQVIQYGGQTSSKGLPLTEHIFILKRNEVITRISMRSSGLSRVLVDIKFDTNFQRNFGPFAMEFSIDAVDKATGRRNYLHSMTARVVPVDYSDFDGLSFVRFRWVGFSKLKSDY